MPSGECPRNERRVCLPEDPLPRLSESSRVADMFEQAQWCHVAHVDTFVCQRCAAPGHVSLLESPTHVWECVEHLSVFDCFSHPLCVLGWGDGFSTPQAPRLLRQRRWLRRRRRDCTSGPPPHNVDDLVADAVCRFEESEAPATAIDTDAAVVCEWPTSC